METIGPRGVAKFYPRGMNGTIYVEDHLPLLHTKYQSCGPSGFREEDFFLVFPIVSLWDLSVAMETTILIQSAPDDDGRRTTTDDGCLPIL